VVGDVAGLPSRSRKAAAWQPIARTVVAPAAWFFGAIWLIAVGVLVVRGHVDLALGATVVLLPVLFFSWITVLLTDDPPQPASRKPSRPRLLAQVLVVLAIATLIGLSAMSAYQVGPRALGSIPVWSGIFSWLLNLGRALPIAAPAAISSPVLELALPLVLLLGLGATWQDLGFGSGHRVGRVLALWCAPQFVNLGVLISIGQAHPLQLIGVFLRNGFQNGPVEEFLFRGALQTRLSFLFGGPWGLVLSALAFGVWHQGANARLETGGELLSAACAGIAGQAPFGIAFGVIFQRTRNLLAGSIVHMVVDLP
jgi:membrane protease YdiL (CAAX protease family)